MKTLLRLALILLLCGAASPVRSQSTAAGDPTTSPVDDRQPSSTDWSDLDEALLEDDDWLQPDPADRDPMEGINRATHGFNAFVLDWVVDPVNRLYRLAVPAPARRGVARFFSNLNEPVILVNDLLQFAPNDAGQTGARFLVNSTVGLAGLFDPARTIGLPGHHTDFGETLAVYGAPSGSYVVIPVLGPSSVRDAFGEIVDGVLSVDFWVLGAGPQLLLTTGGGMVTYDVQQERLDALRGTSVDYYAALRGAYLLDRDAQVAQRRTEIPWRNCGSEDAVEGSEPALP